MRIISGKFRGRKLIKFNKEGIKPTTDKMRESIFNIVISYLKINEKKNNLPLENFNVLDIFAGTGALGLEAISRGAEKVTFIEKSRDNLRVLYKNTDLLEIKEKVKIIKKSISKVKKICKDHPNLHVYIMQHEEDEVLPFDLHGKILENEFIKFTPNDFPHFLGLRDEHFWNEKI